MGLLVVLLVIGAFAAGCYVPPRRAKACSTCGSRKASGATQIK